MNLRIGCCRLCSRQLHTSHARVAFLDPPLRESTLQLSDADIPSTGEVSSQLQVDTCTRSTTTTTIASLPSMAITCLEDKHTMRDDGNRSHYRLEPGILWYPWFRRLAPVIRSETQTTSQRSVVLLACISMLFLSTLNGFNTVQRFWSSHGALHCSAGVSAMYPSQALIRIGPLPRPSKL